MKYAIITRTPDHVGGTIYTLPDNLEIVGVLNSVKITGQPGYTMTLLVKENATTTYIEQE